MNSSAGTKGAIFHFKTYFFSVTHKAHYLSYKVKMQYVHCRFTASYFLFSWRNPAEMRAYDQSSVITKGSIYYVYIQPFSMGVD